MTKNRDIDWERWRQAAGFVRLAAGIGEGQRKKSGSSPTMIDGIREVLRKSADLAEAQAQEGLAKQKMRRENVGDGAHDPGARIIVPRPDEDIIVEKYHSGIALDNSNSTFITGTLFRGMFDSVASWRLCENRGNYPVKAIIHGKFSEGWQEDAGPALAVTITHCHRPGFFPYSDSLYADELPLDRFAAMLDAAYNSPNNYCTKQPVIVIDNRNSHREEHRRLAALEKRDEIRFPNHGTPARGALNVAEREIRLTEQQIFRRDAEVVFGEPQLDAIYDPARRELHDKRSGLTLEISKQGDIDYEYKGGFVRRGHHGIASLSIHPRHCWRPDYGPTILLNLNRARLTTRREGSIEIQDVPIDRLPFAEIAPLLNEHPDLFPGGRHMGHAILVDTRSDPLPYYYG